MVWALGALMICVWLSGFGCASAHERGDRAMASGDTGRAMVYYEQAIEDGSRDPELFFRAAQAAQSQGAFAEAERYYSQSLRYGGGTEVARALAEFYIQTSNFSQAARVFQYLARTEEDIQPLYTNIGTALMYAGKYLDAESYLLLAHQMAPEEPVPYINLGVLYDRYLRNRPRAVRFYECYTDMSDDAAQVRMVRTRLREIANEGPVDTSRVHLECGEEYQIHHQEHRELGEIFDLDETTAPDEAGEPAGEADESVWEVARDLSLDYEGAEGAPRSLLGEGGDGETRDSSEDKPPVIDRPSSGERGQTAEEDMTLDKAQRLFEAGRYDGVVEVLEGLELEKQFEKKALLGRAYYRVGRFEEASAALEAVLHERPRPGVVEDLLQTYERTGEEDQKDRICERFDGWPDYDEALANCR